MGGIGSGRSGGGPTVESAFSLAVGDLTRIGLLVKGERRSGSIRWSDARTGAETLRVAILADLTDLDRPTMRVAHRDRRDGEQRVYDIDLGTTEQHLGGVRLWFACPSTGWRVGKLYLPLGGTIFASRQAYRLAYRTQRISYRDRAITRAHRLRKRLGADPSPVARIDKPLWMHWSTYDGIVARIREAENRSCECMVPAVMALLRRTGHLRPH